MTKYDFERIGKQQVLNDLLHKIKGKADYLQTKNVPGTKKMAELKDLEKMCRDAHKILGEL